MTAKESEKQALQDGKIIDFIDGKLRKDTETEQVRQNFERTLVEEYRYTPKDVSVNFKIKVMEGSKKVTKTISLVVFHEKRADKPTQDDVHILISVAKPKTQPTDLSGGTDDLEKMLIACPIATLKTASGVRLAIFGIVC